ncbi:MAG: hypothetical protein KDD62_02055, partial [Bdellovibrionales bacterium]|nr:hypothetical protein [Bdellovibrionales bacterium]
QVTLASVALAWVRAQSLVDLPLVGASQGEHLLQLISSLSKQITFDNEPVNSHDFTAYKSMWNWRP